MKLRLCTGPHGLVSFINGMASLQGKLLIASPRLMDPNFVRSVVLMVQHSDEGALGLILNRPLGTTVREVCEKVLETDCAIEAFLHQGGPCEGPLMVLHTEGAGGEVEVMPGVHFTAERGKIERLLEGEASDDVSAKFFVGYAGWGSGQLEGELETGSWLTVKAESQHVFDGGEKLWSRLTTAVTAGIDLNQIPEDPSMN